MPLVDEIIALLREFPVSEISVERDGSRITVVSGPDTYQRPVAEIAAELAAVQVAGSEVADIAEEKSSFVTATMVGHFHLPEPALTSGTEIEAGQYVGNIESIKVMNDLLAQVGGLLAETLVDDGAPVEYGQPLYRLN